MSELNTAAAPLTTDHARPRRRPPIQRWRRLIGVLALMVIAGCSAVPSNDVRLPAPVPARPPALAGTGVAAKPASTALPIEGRDMRLVRLESAEIALQFELFNGSNSAFDPSDVGINGVERNVVLIDPPRATAYGIIDEQGLSTTRLSAGDFNAIPPGQSRTVTAVFTGPAGEAAKLLVLVGGLRPIEVPVEPEGAVLHDDPVLRGAPARAANIGIARCRVAGGGEGGTQPRVVEYKLPGDVLFEFGKATLTAHAQEAIDAVAKQITGGGALTVEGHTDSVGSDQSNQTLSEQRAAAVLTALRTTLGGQFSYQTAGFGESKPVAPNTSPDGGDNPDGRAQNRRVEIRQGTVTPGQPPKLKPAELKNDLSTAGFTVEVDTVRRYAGFLLAEVTVTNPTRAELPLPSSHSLQGDPGAGGMTLADPTAQRRHQPCLINPANYRTPLTWSSAERYAPGQDEVIPAGAGVTFWGLYGAPAADAGEVEVELDGFGRTEHAPITTR